MGHEMITETMELLGELLSEESYVLTRARDGEVIGSFDLEPAVIEKLRKVETAEDVVHDGEKILPSGALDSIKKFHPRASIQAISILKDDDKARQAVLDFRKKNENQVEVNKKYEISSELLPLYNIGGRVYGNLGKGEILLRILYLNSKLIGGDSPVDMEINGTPVHVKDAADRWAVTFPYKRSMSLSGKAGSKKDLEILKKEIFQANSLVAMLRNSGGKLTVHFFDKNSKMRFVRLTNQGKAEINFNPGKEESMSGSSASRGSSTEGKLEFSGAGALGGGPITPLGTGPDGQPTGRSSKQTLKKNAKTQGKSFGGAKTVNEASVSHSMGLLGYYSSEGSYDVDNDGKISGYEKGVDTNSIYRGGGGDLEINAKTTGRAFAGAKPPTPSKKVQRESVGELSELLWELFDFDNEE